MTSTSRARSAISGGPCGAMTPTFPLRALRTARGETFDRSCHPAACEERGCERRRECKAENDPDRRVELDPEILEAVLRRAELGFLRVVQRGGRDEGALLRDEVVTLRADAQHQRPAADDDDEIHERNEKRRRRSDTPALYLHGPVRIGPNYQPRRSISHVSTTSSPVARFIRSWYATVGSTCAGNTADAVADQNGSFQSERDVLVRAVPDGVTDDGRVAVVHPQGLEPAVGDGPAF